MALSNLALLTLKEQLAALESKIDRYNAAVYFSEIAEIRYDNQVAIDTAELIESDDERYEMQGQFTTKLTTDIITQMTVLQTQIQTVIDGLNNYQTSDQFLDGVAAGTAAVLNNTGVTLLDNPWSVTQVEQTDEHKLWRIRWAMGYLYGKATAGG